LLAHGQWFSPGTPASSTTKTGHHDITEILLKVALNTINQSTNQSFLKKINRKKYNLSKIIKSFVAFFLINLNRTAKILEREVI
jgi:hypothetical protein